MRILHVKQTPIAGAPDALSDVINKYTDHSSSVSNSISNCDVVHFHNRSLPCDVPCLIQYHSESWQVDLNFEGIKTVVAQYQAFLEPFRECQLVRNIIDLDSDAYIYVPPVAKKIIVGFSPSTSIQTRTGTKGILETLQVLEKMRFKYLDKFEYRVIQGFPIQEALSIRKQCNILIDECVTESYHRTGLEGLALGRMTICSMSDRVEDLLLKTSGATYSPFENVDIDGLEDFLEKSIEEPLSSIEEKGYQNRRWMETFWNHLDIVTEYLDLYKRLIEDV